MVESFIVAIWKYMAGRARRFAGWICFGPAGLWIVIMVVALVAGRCLWVSSNRPAHQDEIVEAFGSVGYFYGTPQTTRSGDRITFVQTTTNGMGVFVCDTATGQKRVVVEENAKEKGPNQNEDFNIWPWSPDDKLFLYTRGNTIVCQSDMGVFPQITVKEIWGQADLSQGTSGGTLAKISVGDQPVKELAWLTPDKFVYISRGGGLHQISLQKDGKLLRSDFAGVNIDSASLTALTSNSIAWNRTNGIWTMNLESQAVTLLYQPPPGQTLEAFAFSKTIGKFLLKLKQGRQASVWQMLLGEEPFKIAVYPSAASGFNSMNWLNATNGNCAYLCPKSIADTEHVLLLQSGFPGQYSTLFAQGTAETFTASHDGRHIFIVGVLNGEPAESIWDYDVLSQKLQCLVPATDHPSPYARHIKALHKTLNLASGRTVDYYLYAPPDLPSQQHQKHPLVLGNTMFQIPDSMHQYRVNGPLWAEALACCGAYVVIVNRPTWNQGLDQWRENVMAVYQQLSPNPSIDKQRVFLFGVCAETSPLSTLVQERPELWKGLLLLHPEQLPDLAALPSGKPAPKMLISAGEIEKQEPAFKQYQAAAGQQGVEVDLVIHPNSTHWLISIAALRERTKAMVNFIFAD